MQTIYNKYPKINPSAIGTYSYFIVEQTQFCSSSLTENTSFKVIMVNANKCTGKLFIINSYN